MTWKTAVFGLLCASAMLGVGSGASARGARVAVAAPRLHNFSPAAVHPGDDFLIDADFDGRRPPRVWVGEYAIPRSRVHVARDPAPSGARRIWALVPKRVPAGEHTIKIATRAGGASAAKPITVASCNAALVAPSDCGAVPTDGVDLRVTGSGGYSVPIQAAKSPPASKEPSDASTSFLVPCGDDGEFRCLTVRMTTADVAEIHVGTVAVIDMSYYDGKTGKQWVKDPGGSVQVVSASPTRVGLCIDAVLKFAGHVSGKSPATVNVKGYLVFSR